MAVRNVILVHGAFADGSSWSKVIPLLLARGYRVTSVAIPLTSYAEDVAATRRAVSAQEGPVLLVGHSYGGVVIGARTTTVPSSHAVMLSHATEVAQVIDEAALAVAS